MEVKICLKVKVNLHAKQDFASFPKISISFVLNFYNPSNLFLTIFHFQKYIWHFLKKTTKKTTKYEIPTLSHMLSHLIFMISTWKGHDKELEVREVQYARGHYKAREPFLIGSRLCYLYI